MSILLQLFEIVFLQRRPQDLDYDEFAAAFCVVFSLGLGYVANSHFASYSSPLAYTLIPGLAQVGLLYGVLHLNDKSNRFVQTCTALFGIQAVLSSIIFLFSLVSALLPLIQFLMLWNVYLTVLIFKEALDTHWLRAILVTVVIQVLAVMALIIVFPEFVTEFIQSSGLSVPAQDS